MADTTSGEVKLRGSVCDIINVLVSKKHVEVFWVPRIN